MKRLLTLLALAGLGAATACGGGGGSSNASGDDDDTSSSKNSSKASKDAGKSTKDAGKSTKDAGDETASRGVQIDNLGDPCESADDCMGDGQVDCTTNFFGTDFPGGYCTAACTTDDECGSDGACPFASIGSLAGGLGGILGGALPGGAAGGLGGAINCVKKCDKDDSSTCDREGYKCTTLSELPGVGMFASFLGAGASTPLCLPPVTVPMIDASVPIVPSSDAGHKDASTVVGGSDAGKTSDAGHSADAGTAKDAGR